MIRGRPPKFLDPHPSREGETIADGIVNDLRAGLFASDACARAGISTDALNDWLDRGITQESVVRRFYLDNNPDALDCDHTWAKGSCRACGTSRQRWDELVASDAENGVHVELLRAVQRAKADAKAGVLFALLDALNPLERKILRDDDGEPVYEDGKLRTYMPGRRDPRPGMWWLERVDPKQFHLLTRAEEAGVEAEPEVEPQHVLDDVHELAERYSELDTDT